MKIPATKNAHCLKSLKRYKKENYRCKTRRTSSLNYQLL